MTRNNEGKIVDENGVEVFKSDVVKRLAGPDHLIKVCPNTRFLNVQIEQAYLPNKEDTRKFVEYHVSKLVDDNTSLASSNEIHNAYIDDVVCLLGMVNGISKKAPATDKNAILGGTFPTKNDNSEDSKAPLYLITEMLKAKCLKDLDKPVSNLDNYDLTDKSTVAKDSTLGKEFDNVIALEKQLDYDKAYFSGDMSNESMDYFCRCSYTLNVDTAKNNPAIDNYVKVEQDKCDLYVTQGDIVNNITMFKAEQKQQSVQDIAIPKIEVPVINNETNKTESNVQVNFNNNSLENNNVNVVNQTDQYKVYLEKNKITEEKYQKLIEIRNQLKEIQEKYNKAEEEYNIASKEERESCITISTNVESKVKAA